MATITVADYASDQTGRNAAIRKSMVAADSVLFVLYIFNYLDRINIGFAALSMNKDLALTATTFGLANSIFYVGYVACEVPSNLLMVRYGARIWIARILISWGLASAATMLVAGPNSLYLIRFLVGVLEAGFVPGVLLYLTYWIPNSHRAPRQRLPDDGAAGRDGAGRRRVRPDPRSSQRHAGTCRAGAGCSCWRDCRR